MARVQKSAVPFKQLKDIRGVKASEHAGKLDRVTFLITNRCNFNCKYCLSKPQQNGHADLDSKAIHKAIQELDGKAIVRFSGGEPSLHPEFLSLLHYAAQKGPVEVLTNGRWIPYDPKECASFFEPFLNSPKGNLFKNIQIQISADPEHFKHDPNLRKRILSYANFLEQKMLLPGYLEEYPKVKAGAQYESLNYTYDLENLLKQRLAINVRGKFSDEAVKKWLDLRNFPPGSKSGLNLIERLPRGMSDSVVAVGNAKNFQEDGYKVHPFSKEKEYDASIHPTLAISPKGVAFTSVYSVYENQHNPEFKLAKVGNLHTVGISGLAQTLDKRILRWREFRLSDYDPFHSPVNDLFGTRPRHLLPYSNMGDLGDNGRARAAFKLFLRQRAKNSVKEIRENRAKKEK